MKKKIMTHEEIFQARIDVIKELTNIMSNDKPYFSTKWLIDNILSSDDDREKARREIIYEKRKRIINKILNKDNE
jgi:hypothetical protein